MENRLWIHKKYISTIGLTLLILLLCACGTNAAAYESDTSDGAGMKSELKYYTEDTLISDVSGDPVFEDYGRLIFPVDSGYMSGSTLGNLRLTWYSNIDPKKTVEICNYFRSHAKAGEVIFYDIYTDAEKKADPDKEDTGLFFFKTAGGNSRLLQLPR